MKYQVTEIKVTFSNGSFAEWANVHEENEHDDIVRWEQQYNAEITKAIKEVYPYAKIEVGEDYNQLAYTKFYVDFEEVDFNSDYDCEDYEVRDDVIANVTYLIDDVGNKGSFWD